MKLYPRFLSRIGMALLLLLSGLMPILLLPTSVRAAPPLPAGFYGTVTDNGEPVAAGTVVSAWINDVLYAQTPTFLFNGDAVYVLDVPGDDPETQDVVEGGTSDDMISFKVGEQTVAQTAAWQSGTNVALNLQIPQTTPTITLTGPTSAQMGTSTTLFIAGQHTHFVGGTTTVNLGDDITIDAVQVGSATALTVSITLAPNAIAGLRAVTVTTGAEVVTQDDAFTVLSASVSIAIPSTITGTPGIPITAPILVGENIVGREVISFQFTLTYDPAVLQYVGIAKENTLSAAWEVIGNSAALGIVHVVGYGTPALSGAGVLVKLRFTVTVGAAADSALALSDFIFNEGEPSVVISNGHFMLIPLAATVNISGTVSYRTGNTYVSTATVTAAGPSSVQTITGNDGHYELTVPARASYLVTVQKTGDQRDAISAVDAAQIAQCVTQRANVVCDPTVSDVSGDGTVTAYDAARIAHFLVGLDGERTGQWQFEPPTRVHADLDHSIGDENFTAYLLGDVSGNWASDQDAGAAAIQSSIRLTIAQVSAVPGTEVAVPIFIGDMGETEVLAYEFTVAYNKDAFLFQRVMVTDTLSQGWPIVYNDQTPGILPLVGYHSDRLAEDGLLLKLIFTVSTPVTTDTDITFTKNRIMDQVLPPANMVDELPQAKNVFLPTIVR